MQAAPQIPLQQHPNFAAALNKLGRETKVIELDGSAPVQTIVRFGLRFASRGPIWLDGPTTAQAPSVRAARLHLINSNGGDQGALRGAGFRRIVSPVHVGELSILGTRSDRIDRMKGKWRNSFRKALKSPQTLQVDAFRTFRHHWLLDADLKQQKTKAFRSLPHAFLQAYSLENPKNTPVFTAYLNGEPIAAMVFLVHGSVATYHLGWTSLLGRENGSHHAILMRAADHLSRRGVERIDLGTVDKANAPGLARFKIGTGATIRPLGGTWLRLPLL
ncbi:GNAT family N-acetyltransferase [Rhodobacteraceae bacterium]|nr:GNAT family N-acetyltransferase [Paracoccaceae bacterium]